MPILRFIVLREGSSQTERFAAEELAHYASMITGSKVSIIDEKAASDAVYLNDFPLDYLGNAKFYEEMKHLGEDGFIIRSIGDSLVIHGNTSRAILFGVYHLLQLLGVRWYFPGKEHEYIPKMKSISLSGFDVKDSPAFSMRAVLLYHGDIDAVQEWIYFAPKVKLNTIILHTWRTTHPSFEYIKECKKKAASRGLDIAVALQGFFGTKLCPTDKEELERNKIHLRRFLEGLPLDVGFFLRSSDWPKRRCECEKCRDLSLAEQIILFMKKMVGTLREFRPNAELTFDIYQLDVSQSEFQRIKEMKADDFLAARVAPIRRCYSHSLTDPLCTTNKEFLSIIDRALEIFNPGEAHVVDYWVDPTLFNRGIRWYMRGRVPQIGAIIKDDLKYLKSKGIGGMGLMLVAIDEDYLSSYTSPTIFLAPMLMWNPDADIESELKLFAKNFFGRKDLVKVFSLREQVDPRDYYETVSFDDGTMTIDRERRAKELLIESLDKHMSDVKNAVAIIEKALNVAREEKARIRLSRLLAEYRGILEWPILLKITDEQERDMQFIDLLCICNRCPMYMSLGWGYHGEPRKEDNYIVDPCFDSGGRHIGYCLKGRSKNITRRISCVCEDCLLHKKSNLKAKFYCLDGSEPQQRTL